MCIHSKSLQSYPTLCKPMDCSLPGSSVHGILQAKTLEWVATPSARRSSWYRDETHTTFVSCIAGGFFSVEPLGKLFQVSDNSVPQSCLTLWDPINCIMPGFPVHHQLWEPAQTHVHQVGDAIQPSHHLSSAPAFNLSQHHDLFQWVRSSHQGAKILELQLQHQSSQWMLRTDFL